MRGRTVRGRPQGVFDAIVYHFQQRRWACKKAEFIGQTAFIRRHRSLSEFAGSSFAFQCRIANKILTGPCYSHAQFLPAVAAAVCYERITGCRLFESVFI